MNKEIMALKLFLSKEKGRWSSLDPDIDEAIALLYQQEGDKISAISVLGGAAVLMFFAEKLAESR